MAQQNDAMRTMLRNLKVLEGPFLNANLDTLPDTPQAAFVVWFEEVVKAGVKEPHAMTLSTVDEQGRPDARVLILKNVDNRGWHFAIKSSSPKGHQIAGNSHVALTFHWREIGRQVRIRGKAVKLAEEECFQDFTERPLSSKVIAIASKQSQVLHDSDELALSVEQAKSAMANEPEKFLPAWAVYAVRPESVELWQGAKDRLHKRLQFVSRPDGSWEKQHLWP